MNGEWCFFKSYLSKEKCREIIELAKNIPEQDAKVGVNDSSRLSEFRRSKIIRVLFLLELTNSCILYQI